MGNNKPLVWAGTITLIILSIFLLASTDHVINTAAGTNTVSFSGEGKVQAKPDIATADFSIVTQDTTSKAAQDANSTKSEKLVKFLKDQGIDDKDIKTSGYSVYPQYSYRTCPVGSLCPNGGQQITGYQATQTVTVKIRNLDKASAIVDGAVTAGVNQVNQLQFTIENPEKLKDEAREKAIADAKSRADVLEKQIGIRLGKIVNFTENTGGYPVPMYSMKDSAMGMGSGMGGGPSLPSGENEITVNVQVTYQIK